MWNRYKNKNKDNKDVMKKTYNNYNDDDYDSILTFYYLLYELKDCEILWIVSASDFVNNLKDIIKNVSSNSEKYYIVSKEISYSEYNKKIKQFTKFIPDDTCILLYETKFSNIQIL